MTTAVLKVLRTTLILAAVGLTTVGLTSEANAAGPAKLQTMLGNDEQTFVFAGHCRTGETYKLFAYQKTLEGVNKSFYDYDGPAGRGTVETETPPKVMAVRVCIREVEISDAYR